MLCLSTQLVHWVQTTEDLAEFAAFGADGMTWSGIYGGGDEGEDRVPNQ